MDSSELGQINNLLGEYQNAFRALEALDANARIDSMMLGGVSVRTTGWGYPPQMVESIKGLLRARMETIGNDLNALGFTGDREPSRPPEPPEEPDEPT